MRLVLQVILSTLLGACAPGQPEYTAERQEANRVWPSPPEEARIRLIKTISDPQDLGIRPSAFRKFMGVIAGAMESGMVRPYAVAANAQKILVADPGMHAVHLFDLDRRSYQLISAAGEKALSSPVGVALGDGKIFVADSALGEVHIFDEGADLVFTISGLERPTGLAFGSPAGRLYVADTLAHKIVIFDIAGQKLSEFGTRGTRGGEFNFPSHIFFSGNRLLVNDNMNFRVQAFDADGGFLSAFGTHGDGSGHFSQPKGVAADSRGHVYVAGATIDRVQVFSREGVFLLAFGSRGNGPGEFMMPTGITIVDDRIYVADSLNSRVQVFEYVGE